MSELKEAIENKNITEVADALTDILYVTYGAGHAFGINLDKCFEEVQNSNMSKLGHDGKPIYNEKGKVMKGPNYFKPLIIHNILQSIEIMSDSSKTFAMYCVKGIKADKKRIKKLLNNSLMLVTALAPKIGYDKAAFIAKTAHKNGTTLKQEVIKAGLINEKEYDKIMDPLKMTRPK